MPYQHPTLTYRGPPKRTYDEGPGGQVGRPTLPDSNRRLQASHQKVFASHPTAPVNRSCSSGSTNSAISNNNAGWWKWKRGSNNEPSISTTTNQDENLSTPHRGAHREQKWKRGNGINNNASTNNASTNTSRNNSLPLPQAAEYEESTKKDYSLPSPQTQEHTLRTAFQKPTDPKGKKIKINKGSDVTMDDSPSAQVPAFYHLLLLESLGAPGSELKDEYVRERRRLAKLYGLQLNQTEGEVAMEYMENRVKGMEAAAARREKVKKNNGKGSRRRRRQG